MAETTDPADTRGMLSRMVEAITAAQAQTPWPAAELADLAQGVLGEDGSPRVWSLT